MSEFRDEAGQLETLVHEVIRESKDLRRDVMAYEAAHRRERRAYRFMGAFLVASIVVCLILIATARAGMKNTQEAVDLVRSCTTPTGDCYKRQQAGTGDFRQRLLGVISIITDCDVAHDDLVRFRTCVSERTGLQADATSVPVEDPLRGKS